MQNLSSDQTGHLIYLLALLLFLGSGIFFKRKIKASQILSQLFLWFLIILTIIFLYSWRFEFQSAKNRIIHEIFPSTAIINKQGQIVIGISSNGHYHIDLKINDQDVSFMIDTGASDMVIDRKDAQRIGINLQNLQFNKIYSTANGTTYGAPIILNKVEINGIFFYQIPASVNQSSMNTSLLGMRFLQNFKKYEFYQDKLILTL